MPSNQPKPPPRKPRADAQRNRARILEIAKEAFTRSGANISLDDVARQARIGAGTLYRHFPTRDSLLEAVYRTEVEKLAAAEREFAESMPPVEALRAWMLLFVDYIATKQIIAPALNNIVGGPSKLFATTGAQIKEAVNALVKRAIESGDVRPDLDPLDSAPGSNRRFQRGVRARLGAKRKKTGAHSHSWLASDRVEATANSSSRLCH
jgi:AcrR family transcriptional regulator